LTNASPSKAVSLDLPTGCPTRYHNIFQATWKDWRGKYRYPWLE